MTEICLDLPWQKMLGFTAADQIHHWAIKPLPTRHHNAPCTCENYSIITVHIRLTGEKKCANDVCRSCLIFYLLRLINDATIHHPTVISHNQDPKMDYERSGDNQQQQKKTNHMTDETFITISLIASDKIKIRLILFFFGSAPRLLWLFFIFADNTQVDGTNQKKWHLQLNFRDNLRHSGYWLYSCIWIKHDHKEWSSILFYEIW